MNSIRNINQRSLENKYLETNDNNWYKLCRKEITFKQLRIDENKLQTKGKVDQIKFNMQEG